ncbi:hypothetical protein HY311_00200 [Candidatus Nomurabacteria bacterium]|nr:hypothetical protein [Candidatus Nomurabacteria bacterium]
MKKDTFVFLVSLILLIIGVVHIVRLIIGWQVQIAGIMVPMWIYGVEAVVFICLSFVGFRLTKKGE